jgi:hypothetical protein
MLPARATATALKVENTQRAVANCSSVTSEVFTPYQLQTVDLVSIGGRAERFPCLGGGPCGNSYLLVEPRDLACVHLNQLVYL